MNCKKCQKFLPDDAVLCCYCGSSQTEAKQKGRTRANGTGSVYKRGSTWTARVVDHYVESSTAKNGRKPVWKTKGGFLRKKDALNYLPTLIKERSHDHPPKPFKDNFDAWKEQYESRIKPSTMSGYVSAFKYFKSFWTVPIDRVSAVDLQSCIDDCPRGKRTKQLMKISAGLVFKYAIDDDQITKNNAANLYVGDDETTHYEPLTEEELKIVEQSDEEYADYVVAMCYLGHRPSEFFGFHKSDYHYDQEKDLHYIYGGIKSEAGKTRAVTIPPKVLPIIQRRLEAAGTDLLFPRIDRDRKGVFTGYSQMPVRYFNKSVWHPMMERLSIVGKVPYAARHTYANKMKKLVGAEVDKAGLMGHASYETTKKHYQSTNLADKKAITDQMA